ncbi:activating transcription factor 7-interacting protein 2 isoform X3 [Engraulis encrasicolus]|uniref:activating transcription factor 7-interacting protein 2 isoform X3 n=1 Tax=Engraulis encrasicolus TaxID=184585 RepID=UPI002FD16430
MSAMKRKRADGPQLPPIPRGLSEAQVQEMVSQKFSEIIKNQDSTLQNLQKKLSESDAMMEDRFKQFNAHIQKVKRRGDAAIAYMKHLKSQGTILPSAAGGAVTNSRISWEGRDSPGVSSESESRRQPVEGFWQARKAKIQTVDLTSEEMCEFPESNRKTVKTQPDSSISLSPEKCNISSPQPIKLPATYDSSQHVTTPSSPRTSSPLPIVKQEPQLPAVAKKIKTEEASYEPDYQTPPPSVKEEPHSPKAIIAAIKKEETPQDDWRTKLQSCLPDTPFPASLPFDATTKNVPQKPLLVVRYLDTKDKHGIFAKVDVEQVDRYGAEMDCYHVYGAQEALDGTISRWQLVGNVKATPLPIYFQLSMSDSNQRLFFTIVGKDKYGRYGPYSEIQFICKPTT